MEEGKYYLLTYERYSEEEHAMKPVIVYIAVVSEKHVIKKYKSFFHTNLNATKQQIKNMVDNIYAEIGKPDFKEISAKEYLAHIDCRELFAWLFNKDVK